MVHFVTRKAAGAVNEHGEFRALCGRWTRRGTHGIAEAQCKRCRAAFARLLAGLPNVVKGTRVGRVL